MATANPLRFSTKYTDGETDVVYYGYRFYNPSTGRWPNRDPIQESAGFRQHDVDPSEPNIHAFVVGDPINSFDPFGLATYRLEVVVGERLSMSGAGLWAQPAWAGTGDWSVNGTEAWSKVSVRNAPWLGRHTTGGDYCNTVDFKGEKGDAGEIRVYVTDPCGGNFRLEVSFSTFLFGDGPIKIKSSASLKTENRTLWYGKAVGAPHAELAHSGIYGVNARLKANQEQLVLRYIPTIAFPVPPAVSEFVTSKEGSNTLQGGGGGNGEGSPKGDRNHSLPLAVRK